MGSTIIRCTSAAIILLSLAACGSNIQTTSGRAYLERYPTPGELATKTGKSADQKLTKASSIDQRVRKVAAVEPTLRFPARIGLARISRGELSGITPLEADAWMKAAKRLGPEFGQFVPVSRLVAEMVASPTNTRKPRFYVEYDPTSKLYETMAKIRLGAARQHLDAVLVYEVYGHAEQEGNPLSALNFTIIGAYMLPGESVRAQGFASALLVDVRNGYPYGTARKVVKRSEITSTGGSSDVRRVLYNATKIDAVVALVPEVETMFRKLQKSFAELGRAKQKASRR